MGTGGRVTEAGGTNGGGAPGDGGPAGSCTDRVQNGNETDVDCGGGTCPKCGAGMKCQSRSDCASNNCEGLIQKTCEVN
jgi:hypothetical protein